MIKFSEHLTIWFFIFIFYLSSLLLGFGIVMNFIYPEEVYAFDVIISAILLLFLNYIYLSLYDEWKSKRRKH